LQELASNGLELIDAPLNADLHGLLAQGDVRLAVISLKHTADRDLSICNRVVPLVGRNGGSVLLCSAEWTRTSVLKALKAGVKGILMPPIDSQELTARVSKLLEAA